MQIEKKVLKPHQIEDLTFYISNEKCMNLSDPGCQKTGSVCVYIEYLYTHEKTKTIWAMPKSLLRKNKIELLEFTNLTEDQIVILDGSPKQRMTKLMNPKAVVFLTSFTGFADNWKIIKEQHPDTNALMFDEIHMAGVKSPKSKRSQQLFDAGKRLKYFLAMSGTLIAGRLDSCYTTIKVIEPRYYYNHFGFLAEHAIQDEYGNVVAWTNHEKIGRIFLRHAIRRSFESVHGKEEKVLQRELVEMHEAQRKIYTEFEQKALIEMQDSFIDGGNPAVAAMRCRQILAHPHALIDSKDPTHTPQCIPGWNPEWLTGKEEALEVHIQDHINTGKPLCIFASLQAEQRRILELVRKWGLTAELINASVSGPKRHDIDVLYREGKIQCLVASPATAAVGFNWSHVDHCIFMSLDYENVNFVQAYRRFIRGKRAVPLRITVMEYEDSIDQKIFAIVDRKSRDLTRVDDSYEKLTLSDNSQLTEK